MSRAELLRAARTDIQAAEKALNEAIRPAVERFQQPLPELLRSARQHLNSALYNLNTFIDEEDQES